MRGCKRRKNQIARHKRRATSLKDVRYAQLAQASILSTRLAMIRASILLGLKAYTIFAGVVAIILLSGSNNQNILMLSNIRLLLFGPAALLFPFFLAKSPFRIWSFFSLIALLGLPWSLFSQPDYCARSLPNHSSNLKVMTLNLAGSSEVNGRNLSGLATFHGLDVLALQEVSPNFWKTEGAKLRKLYPHFAYRESASGYWTQALLSKHPFELSRIRDPGPGFSNFASRLVLDVQILKSGQKLSILVTHLSVPFFRGPCRGLSCLLSRYRQTDRDRQLQQLAKWSAEKDHPVIILGDLNLSDQNPIYSSFARDFIDAGRCTPLVSGTWPADGTLPFPVTRIDYALYHHPRSMASKRPIIASSETVYVPGTDHLAVIANFSNQL